MCISVLLSKYINWNLAENSVSILFVGDGFPVPLHSSLFTASPNPFGRFSRLLREAKRLPYALTNWNLLSCLGSGVRVDAVRGLAPRIYEGGATSSQTGGGGSPSPTSLSQKRTRNKDGKYRKVILFTLCFRKFVLPPSLR